MKRKLTDARQLRFRWRERGPVLPAAAVAAALTASLLFVFGSDKAQPVGAAFAAASVAALFESVPNVAPTEHRGISRGAAWGDYDGDGDPDLFVTHPTWDGPVQHNALYRNDGDGRFSVVDIEPGPADGWEGAAWIDLDGDGDLDLHVVGRNGAGSMLYRNDGAGGLEHLRDDPFGGRIRSASMACWADADGDGILDVFVAGYREGRNALFRGLGSWRFDEIDLPDRAVGTGTARACAWGDLDGDGLPELVIANAREANQLLRNRGGMELESDSSTGLESDTTYGYGLSFADIDGDGARDLFVANFDADNSVYRGGAGEGGPDGSLHRVPDASGLQSAASKGHAWGDFDLDGRIDLYLGSGTPAPGMLNRIYLGDAAGGFDLHEEGAAAADADTSSAVAAADYDLDGDIDVFVANWGSAGSPDR
ncbi:MAG: VCBS repeat-containing protein, partial [Gemmatimonadota bacterium]